MHSNRKIGLVKRGKKENSHRPGAQKPVGARGKPLERKPSNSLRRWSLGRSWRWREGSNLLGHQNPLSNTTDRRDGGYAHSASSWKKEWFVFSFPINDLASRSRASSSNTFSSVTARAPAVGCSVTPLVLWLSHHSIAPRSASAYLLSSPTINSYASSTDSVRCSNIISSALMVP